MPPIEPFAPINPDIAEWLAERSEDHDKQGFNNLGPGHDDFRYSGTSVFDPINHQIYTIYLPQKINAGAGDDEIFSMVSDNVVYLGSGEDVAYTGTGSDSIYGGSGMDSIIAGLGEDRLSGGSGDDRLFGDLVYTSGPQSGANDDRLLGGSGNDRLTGGAGADVVTGGTGADTFSFFYASDSTPYHQDKITDFSRAEGDKIAFNADLSSIETVTAAPTSAAGTIWVQQLADNHDRVFVNVHGAGGYEMIIDVTLASGSPHLTASDFMM